MKEVVINTSGLNCYGFRVLTSGIDLQQYQKNPVLLWMHRRCFDGDTMPIGRVENLRVDGDSLIGTPVFDGNDEFAKKIEDKWENGFLRMASPSLERIEVSDAPEYLLPGQRRATVTRSKLLEVSIVDIGGNDDALQLYNAKGELIQLAAGKDNEEVPLLRPDERKEVEPNNNDKMEKELLDQLGLPETATAQDAVQRIKLLKEKADKAGEIELASINAVVDHAISERRITADKKDHFISMGKAVGVESLQETLNLMHPMQKPTEVIQTGNDLLGAGQPKEYVKLSEVPADELVVMRKQDPAKYASLYKAEYGVDCVLES
ncbi:hypothetical protein Prede_2588 [Prevotella dentalis DSM 3688]|uniref:Mu-like prophage I protein n=1 Tax=Prevotella dentalis (strain ATCC 49559 / DSM 3688 / JCM 13448 / NCTC 12043 / ES 2772) TaxID=908937 RepID=F9D792_PREDD|nr:hypothetical protein [Prevotella dentalis]AGB29746.1 hypothetical protein Prede_2501 [Prevotella dentalis DSM 3688]AGB29823.1 hypothetical protein Prede_2588 [Prevotella dentalis DSM 3688]EGQ11458.1 hypothetical protein HMPREF9136_2720 [Prevotella dentalis DSM 3688]